MSFCKKRIVSVVVSLAMVITSGIIPATSGKAAENCEKYDGMYGNGVSYTYYKNVNSSSTLILDGEGTTPTISSDSLTSVDEQCEKQPWMEYAVSNAEEDRRVDIDTVLINGKVTLGTYTFANYTYNEKFSGNSYETIFKIGSNVSELPEGCFGAESESVYENGKNLKIFVYGENLKKVDLNAFKNSSDYAAIEIVVANEELQSLFEENEVLGNIGMIYIEKAHKVDIVPLQMAVADASYEKELHEPGGVYDGVYNQETWDDMKSLLSEAETLIKKIDQGRYLEKENISVEELATKVDNLTTGLKDTLDTIHDTFSTLKVKIQTTESNYTEEDYTVGSWNALQTALTEAKKLTEDSDKAAMNDAISAIDTAVAGLVSVKALNEAIAKVEPKNHYTKASWSESGVAEALTNAKAIAADATQVAVDAATQALTEAAKKLDLKTLLDISTLENTVKAYRSFDEADYTEDTWSEFITAYNMAKAYVASGVYKLPESLTQADIDDLNAEVRGAAKSLVRSSNAEARAELKKLLEEIEAKGYKAEDYSEDDNKKQIWNNFANALEVAKGSVDSETQSISSIKLTINNLKEAEAALSALAAPPVVDKKDAYLEYSGSWTKKAETNNMTGYKPDNSKVTVNTSAGDNNWIQIDGLDLSALSNPTLEVEYNANGDTLQVYTDTDWEKALTNGTESSGKYSVSLDKGITTLIFSHNADKLEYTKIKIYDNKEAVQDPVKEAKEQLAAVVSDAEKLKESDYTAESWAALVEALDAASKLTNDSTLEEVNAAKKKIADAVEGLVKAGNDPTPSTPTPPTQGNDDNKNKNDKDPKQENTALKKGAVFTAGKLKYKVTNAAKGKLAVAVQAPKSKKVKSLTIPATVKAKGAVYKVTAIAPNAFKNCKKLTKVTIGKNITTIGKNAFSQAKVLKKITVKSTNLKKVGKNALKGIHKKAVIKVPKKKLKTYKKLFSKKGQKTVKIKK